MCLQVNGVTALAKASFPFYPENCQKQYAYSWKGQDHIFIILALEYKNSPAPLIIKCEVIMSMWISTEYHIDPIDQ